jgi:calcineurin-like phosphoesterase family protein
VTSDLHFGQAAMFETFTRPCPRCEGAAGTTCDLCNGCGAVPLRPFTSVEEMDETIVARWNEAVKPSHRVYLLGDVAWRRPSLRLLGRLNGHIKMAGGNHDHFRTRDYLAAGVEEVCGVLVFDNVLMTHVPVHPSSRARFALNVHGHTHGSVVTTENVTGDEVPDPWYVNVCVEQTDYRPVRWEEILRLKEARCGA